MRRYEKLLDTDLARIDRDRGDARRRALRPTRFPASQTADDRLAAQLGTLADRGSARFAKTVKKNTQTRDLSNALFAVVALLFVMVQGRLRRRIEEGRSLVERLQRAFISSRRELRNVDAGSVLISATHGSNVGGDVYDLFTFDRRRGMFMVADVSGKGIDAAVDTALIKYSLRTLLREDGDPGRALSKFGSLYAQSAENPETFVVIFLGVIDFDTGTVRYASAGHEPAWALFGQNVRSLPPTGPIVGIDADAEYETRTILLRPGDGIVVSTDGLTESRSPKGELLGAEGVAQLARRDRRRRANRRRYDRRAAARAQLRHRRRFGDSGRALRPAHRAVRAQRGFRERWRRARERTRGSLAAPRCSPDAGGPACGARERR